MGKNRFKEALLGRKEFVYILELVPGRGSRGKTQDDLLKIVEKAAEAFTWFGSKRFFQLPGAFVGK